MAADRQPKVRRMIMQIDDDEARRAALDELLPLQQGDFDGLFEAMDGHPVTIRLLDPPLHEFLPDRYEIRDELKRAELESTWDLPDLQHQVAVMRALEESNPMLGTRGVRLGHPLRGHLRDAGAGDRARRAGGRRGAPACIRRWRS